MTSTLVAIRVADYDHVIDTGPIESISRLLERVPPSEVGYQTLRPRRGLMDLRGLGKEIWAGVDPVEYVRGLRAEWDR
jgi:hypothetical protein